MSKVTTAELTLTLLRKQVAAMSPAQFAAYESAIRSQPDESYVNNPDLILALRAVNERRAAELSEPLSVTVRESSGFTIPLWGWALGIAALALLVGPRR